MAGEALVSDYIAIILRAIDKAQNDPAHMRRLIYDLARISLGRQILLSYEEIGSTEVQRHVSGLEAAIKQAEILSGVEGDLLSDKTAAPLLPAGQASDQKVPSVSDPAHVDDAESESGAVAVAVLPSFLAFREDHNPPLTPQTPQAIPSEIWDAVPRSSKRPVRKSQLLAAAAIGMAIFALTLVRPDLIIDLKIPYFSPLVRQASGNRSMVREPAPKVSVVRAETSDEVDQTKSLGFPLPAVYGVYAASKGKLHGLQPLAIKVPDPRVQISALISNPSRLTLPDGKVAFIVFRRDLRSSAPDKVLVRVVARVMQEMKFAPGAPAKITNVAGEWAIRSKSFEFAVTPLNNNPEMIILRPQDPQFSFTPGRYALVLKGEGYDFNVAGQLTDPSQCLERTDALGGAVYSECRVVR